MTPRFTSPTQAFPHKSRFLYPKASSVSVLAYLLDVALGVPHQTPERPLYKPVSPTVIPTKVDGHAILLVLWAKNLGVILNSLLSLRPHV